MGGKLKGPLPKSISTMVEFHTMYWTCPQCGIDFAVLVLHGIWRRQDDATNEDQILPWEHDTCPKVFSTYGSFLAMECMQVS